ncbi:hypothetical protein H9L12_05775 [Sphingomonas rhizophila]|uniref:MobA-like NTP transferase domain-containing protein n=1 Tax=Sphingomonas rhizophila TaxID=2071607 RepID=A0A7G9SDT3_9SPHN|nr:hypothetical protein [Sphingomonas rhizophila]QNN66008.1 hypothetical protein H9L12_05775 [Sphingomonas rhizophila]
MDRARGWKSPAALPYAGFQGNGQKGLRAGMALGALIGAYQEDEAGGLRALLPLAGQTLLEYQARCLAAAGASPIVVLVERMPPAINEAIERLRGRGSVSSPSVTESRPQADSKREAMCSCSPMGSPPT